MGTLNLFPVAVVLGVDPVKRDLTLLLDPVGGDSVSPSCSVSGARPRGLDLVPVNSTLGLTRRLLAVPVVSEDGADWLGTRLMIPWIETGSTDGTVIDSGRPEKPPEKEGTRGPVGSRELGKVVCSTGSLGGKIDPSGPVPPKPVSGRRAVGLNRKPVTDASLGRNFSKLVTAGTVGTLSVTGRWLG